MGVYCLSFKLVDMQLIVLLLGTLLMLVHGSPASKHKEDHTQVGHPRIVGGQEATPHQFPWQISLQYHIFAIGLYSHRCGATIIDETHIACAAHCIDGETKNHFRVVAGAHSLHPLLPESSKQIRKVSQMWQHEEFNQYNFTHDVSVLELDEPLEFNEFVQPLKLADQGQHPVSGTECINSGWGTTDDGRIADKLQYVMLPIVDREECVADYTDVSGVDEEMVCAGKSEGGVSPCQGDSGGPLFCPGEDDEPYLAGIVSCGVLPCGQENRPGVFTSVGYYRDWIDMHVIM